MSRKTPPPPAIQINRAPVLTLWASVVAQRLGHSPQTALTLGRAVAGLNAHAKAVHLGLHDRHNPDDPGPAKPRRAKTVPLLGRSIPVKPTTSGPRALSASAKPIDPASVERYLQSSFGDALPAARAAMQSLANQFSPKDLAEFAYPLYEEFRPSIPKGKRGWGAKGDLDLARLPDLATRRNPD